MRVPLSWLREYADTDLPVGELAEKLTLAGLEVEVIERIGEEWDRERVLVGQIVQVLPHPNADRLTLPVVTFGGESPMQVVTGAPNIHVGDRGQKVVLALSGAKLYDGYSEEPHLITLKPGSIRGVRSEAMLCSEKELGLSEEHEGILLLPDEAPVGTPLADYLGDTVFTIGITPNFARGLSVIGVAREVAALTGRQMRLAEPTMLEEGEPAEAQARVEIAAPDLCARYCATIVRGVTVGASPFWLQRRLRLCGIRPINNIVDITNYVMLEWGQPLHAFDYNLLHGRSGLRPPQEAPLIAVRRARQGERMTTLDGVERDLDPSILLITDGAGPVAVAGVMGGRESEIGAGTKDVLLEAASFDYIGNRVASRKLGLTSEASYRFGRGVPPSIADEASRRAAELMRALAGGQIQRGIVQAYPSPQPTVVVTLRPERARERLGVTVSDAEMERVLTALGFRVERSKQGWQVETPRSRLDISCEEDLYEEIVRVYGYDRLDGTLLRDVLPPQREDRVRRAEESVRDALVASGLAEAITYSLTDWQSELPLAQAPLTGDDFVRVLNPLTAGNQWLRRSLLPGLLATARDNLRHLDLVRLFEIGRVFLPRAGEELPEEAERLAFVLSGRREPASWLAPAPEQVDFFDAKGVLDELGRRLGMSLELRSGPHAGLHPGRSALVMLAEVGEVGYIGELHPRTGVAYGFPDHRICVCELELAPLLAAWVEWPKYRPISRYPGVIQDIAIVLDAAVPVARVHEVIERAGRGLLASATLFDTYQGEVIEPGKRGLALRLVYQAPDRTPGEEEVRKAHRRIAQRLQAEVGAQLRQ